MITAFLYHECHCPGFPVDLGILDNAMGDAKNATSPAPIAHENFDDDKRPGGAHPSLSHRGGPFNRLKGLLCFLSMG